MHEGRPIPWQLQRIWPALFVALMLVPHSAWAQSPPPRELRETLEQLKEEASAVRTSKVMPAAADFAARSSYEIEPEHLRQALIQPADRDPFIDAYVRWQLTSFQPALDLNSRELLNLLHTLPAMVENPRANQQVMDLMARASDAPSLTAAEFERLQQLSGELDEQTELAVAMNRPALELRDWLHDAMSEETPGRMQLLIEQCAATIAAGWPTRSIKTRITRACIAIADDEAFIPADLRPLAGQLQRLAGRTRRSINHITFMADGSVHVTYSTASVSSRDAEAWIARLAGVQ